MAGYMRGGNRKGGSGLDAYYKAQIRQTGRTGWDLPDTLNGPYTANDGDDHHCLNCKTPFDDGDEYMQLISRKPPEQYGPLCIFCAIKRDDSILVQRSGFNPYHYIEKQQETIRVLAEKLEAMDAFIQKTFVFKEEEVEEAKTDFETQLNKILPSVYPSRTSQNHACPRVLPH
jgi:hypothetical protein